MALYSAPSSAASNGTANLSAMEDTAIQHYVIGDNLRHKAFYDDAIDEFQKALHIQEPLLGDNSITVAKTFYAMGLALRATKEYKQGLYYLEKANAIYEQNGGDGKFKNQIQDCKLNMARTHHSQGVDFQRNGDYDKSILEHRKALAVRESLLGKSHVETARTYYVIGCALSDRGDFDEALAELRRALRTRIIVFGKDHLDVSEVVENMGTVLLAKGNLTSDEITNYKTILLQSLGLEIEGDNLASEKKYEDSMVYYRKALSMEEQCLGDLHPTTCDLYLRMADALGELGDLEASLAEYKCAISIYERLLGKFHVKVANIYNKLATILMGKGEYGTAMSFYAKAYGIYDSTLGNHDDTKRAMQNLRLAAAKERTANESLELIRKAETEFEEYKHKEPSNVGQAIGEEKEGEEEAKEQVPTGELLDVI